MVGKASSVEASASFCDTEFIFAAVWVFQPESESALLYKGLASPRSNPASHEASARGLEQVS